MHDELTALIASDLGITDLPAEEQQSLIAQFGGVALKAATIAVAGKLNEKDRMKFLTLAEEGNATALKTFLDTKIPGHEAIVKTAVAEEIKRFKNFQAS